MIPCIFVFVSYCLPCTLKPLPLVCMKFSVLRCSICLSYTGIGNVFLFRKDEGLFRTGHTNQRTNCPCKLLVTYYFNLSLNCVTYGAALLLARLLYWTRAGVRNKKVWTWSRLYTEKKGGSSSKTLLSVNICISIQGFWLYIMLGSVLRS